MKNLPEVNDIVTLTNIGPTGDRSWTTELWKVTAVNETHANLEAVKPRSYGNRIIVVLSEYKFSNAMGFKED